MTPEEVELDLLSLTRTLEQLNGEVHGSRVGVLDAIRSRGAEFSAASGQVGELQRRVADLKEDLGIARSDPAAPVAPVLALQASDVQQASERHSQLKAQLSELDEGVGILTVLLEVRRILARVADHLSGDRFTQAAENLQTVAASLAEISAPTGIDEPDMIRSAKAEYSRLRASLVAALDAGFQKLVFSGTDGSKASAERLQEVWSLYQVLGLRARRLDWLSSEIRKLLGPLLAAGARLGPGRRLRWKESPALGVSGGWEEVLDAPPPKAAPPKKAPAAAVLEPLLELFLIAERWAGELPEASGRRKAAHSTDISRVKAGKQWKARGPFPRRSTLPWALGSTPTPRGSFCAPWLSCTAWGRVRVRLLRRLRGQFEVDDGGGAIEEFETRLQSRGALLGRASLRQFGSVKC